MSNLTLQCSPPNKPHPEGVHSAICVDVIDMGLVTVEFQGQSKTVPKIKVVFETPQRGDDGRPLTISKNFTASLHPKAKLFEFLSKWRGRPIVPGETIDLQKLLGANCTLIVSHQQNMVGRTYASIDAVSKPTQKLTPSGLYDAAEMRRRIEESRARESGSTPPVRPAAAPQASAPPLPPPPKRPAAVSAAPAPAPEFDPEIGF